jgi:hypothetical protein
MSTWKISVSAFAFAIALSGCATHQQVLLAKAKPNAKIVTVARVPDEGNSPEMDANLEVALQQQGLQVKAPLPAGTRTTSEVDATVSYIDVWRWDIAMYLKSISLRIFDAKTGDLLVSGEWNDSALHGFRDAKAVVNELVGEMVSKVQSASQ